MSELLAPNPEVYCLLPNEARARYMTAHNKLAYAIQNPYGNEPEATSHRIRHEMSEAVQDELIEAQALLFPLFQEQAVQQELAGDVTTTRVVLLENDILRHLSQFWNTGVRVVRHRDFGGF